MRKIFLSYHTITILLIILSKMVLGQNEYIVIFDSLTNGKTMGRVFDLPHDTIESEFTKEGWTPGFGFSNQNHIFYEIPFPIKNGYYEYEVKGIRPYGSSINTEDSDPAFSAMYDGRGIIEPIKYTNDFKQNYFRWNVHFRGDSKTLKAVINCSDSSMERRNSTRAVFDEIRDWVYEANAEFYPFDSTAWNKIRINWNDKTFTIKVNETIVWKTKGKYDYLPLEPRIWIGCAPGNNYKYTATMEGLIFRNVKVVSYSQ